jgi:tRNA (guanine37-N1)-methyltransferase
MKINILTIFPEMFSAWQNEGMVKKAIDNQAVIINVIDFREYTLNKHKKVDDYPFGGKEGMLLMAQPIFDAVKKNDLEDTHFIFPSPKGKKLDQKKMIELSKYKEITLLAGRYEGVDQRVIDTFVDEEISLGDFIITGGELAISVILDGVIRLLPNVLNNSDSFINDSFTDDLLEQPQYTRPFDYQGLTVPEVLISGHHKNIDDWIYEQKLIQTSMHRPDLLNKRILSKKDIEIIKRSTDEKKKN